jgi:hypothetical protein
MSTSVIPPLATLRIVGSIEPMTLIKCRQSLPQSLDFNRPTVGAYRYDFIFHVVLKVEVVIAVYANIGILGQHNRPHIKFTV